MKRTLLTAAVLAISTGCAAHWNNRLRADAGAHTGCPAERVEIVGDVGNALARVRICGAAHLCRWGQGVGGNDVMMAVATGSWRCEPADDSTWVDAI